MVHIYYRFTEYTRYADLHVEAYKVLADALQKDFGIDVNDYTFCKTEFGKPYYKNCPYQFSISHTNGLVVVAIARFAVGLDAEPLNRVFKRGIAIRYLHNESADIWDWTRYESIGKLFGMGIPFQKNEIEAQYTTKYCKDIVGYAVCCACEKEEFSFHTSLI